MNGIHSIRISQAMFCYSYYVKKVIKSCWFFCCCLMRNIIFLIHSGFIIYSSLNIDKPLKRSNKMTKAKKITSANRRADWELKLYVETVFTLQNVCLRIKIWQIFDSNEDLREKFTDKMNKNIRFMYLFFFVLLTEFQHHATNENKSHTQHIHRNLQMLLFQIN